MNISPKQQLKSVQAAVARELELLPDERPTFSLQLGWARNYDELFRGKFEPSNEDQLLHRVLRIGRVIIAGRGGGGQTHLLYRTMRLAMRSSFIPIFVDLKKWTAPDYGLWKDWVSGDIAEGANFLVERFSRPKVLALELDRLPPDTRKLLLVDGLNELSADTGQQILLALNEIVSDQIQMYAIVADRLIRRQLPSEKRWNLASILPFSDDQIRDYCAKFDVHNVDFSALVTPFFLNAAIKGDLVGGSRVAMSRAYLARHSGLDHTQLDRVAAFAFYSYVENRTRTFEFSALAQAVGNEISEKLLADGVVEKLDEKFAFFSHHLIHDYLAAKHVATLPADGWDRQTLNAITFERSSFDVVALVFGLLDAARSDVFLRHLYDWDLYAAGYALAEAGKDGGEAAPEMRTVIFAMLAEKRFDIISATQQRASDALLIARTPDAIPFRDASNFPEVLAAAANVASEVPWFSEWRRLFSTPLRAPMTNEDLLQIRDLDSVKGWTVANVAKRAALSDEQQASLRQWLTGTEPVVRWRLVHALGSFPSDQNLTRLLQILDNDPEIDVRYGAIRSLIEMACISNEHLRISIFDEVCRRAPSVSERPRVLGELLRALIVDPGRAPQDWSKRIKLLARHFFLSAREVEQRNTWRAFVDTVDSTYLQQ